MPGTQWEFAVVFMAYSKPLQLEADLLWFSSHSHSLSFFLRCSPILSPRLECSSAISAHCSLCLCLLDSRDSSVSASQVAGTTSAHHHTQQIFIISRDRVSPCWSWWSWYLDLVYLVIHLPPPTKVLGLQASDTLPGQFCFFKWAILSSWEQVETNCVGDPREQ